MKNLKFVMTIFALTTFLFTACDKDDDDQTTEQEVITTVQLELTPDPFDTSHIYQAKDVDGPGGNPPVIDELQLTSGTTYVLSVMLLDESNPSDVEDLTLEVVNEAAVHLLCFEATGEAVTPTIIDTDVNGKPLGLVSHLTTAGAGTGTLRVVLKHEPDKSAADPCATGETDVEVTFPVKIE